MEAPAITCADLTVRAGKQNILGPVSLEIQPREHVLVVGPSGAGKSTLLRCIAGLTTPSAGTVSIAGAVASTAGKLHLAPHERGVGFLFQGGALWPHMTVNGTLHFVLKRLGLDRAARNARIAELLDLVDLAGFGKRRTPTLSGGEAQRLGLARALAMQPQILLLDEPLGPLDAPRREALLDRLAELGTALGLTTLHVTHDPREAERVASRTIHLD